MAKSARKRSAPLVLIVDDYEDTRVLSVEILGRAGLRVAEAATGTAALEKATELLPEVILMDLALPEIDGWEVIRRLKQDPRTRECRILAHTAHAVEALLRRAEEAGCDAILTKPCKAVDLVDAVRNLMPGPAPAN